MEHIKHSKLIILGSGPAGCTAAIYAARANLEPILITGIVPGGQLTTTTTVDNWPGDYNNLQGPELMQNMLEHAKKLGTNVVYDHINQVDLKIKPIQLIGSDSSYTCDVLIIATGANAKYLGIPSEQQYIGKGVSGCATCDAFFFRNQPVAIVGGGNSAISEAIFLSNIASHVFLVHRRDEFRAEKKLQEHFFTKVRDGKISVEWNSTLTQVNGDGNKVTNIEIQNLKKNVSKIIQCNGVFIAIGHAPNTKLFSDQLIMHNDYIVTNNTPNSVTTTSIPGVFAAGDVTDQLYRQAVVAAATGCMAALDAERYLEHLKK